MIPFDYDACLDRPYEDVWSEFEAAGFTAIEADTVEDLFAYEQDRIGTVESVTIDGNDRFSKGDTCANDVQVMIRYHVFKKCAVTVHGISVQPFSDEDFGGGTKHRELTNSSNGLNLEFTYDSNTKEVLCASIVTFTKLSSAQEQKNVVIGMSKILCPSEDSTAVSNWVSSNIGKKAETTINNFVYELWLGPSGNICYNAGVQNWEQWELNRE